MTISAIAELPFHRRPPLELLGLTEDRVTVDHDYTGFGWAVLERLTLASAATDQLDDLSDVLVVAVHAADDGPAMTADLELEFVVGDRGLLVPLTSFLATWLPRLPTTSEVVLASCNPHRAALPSVSGRAYLYGLGPVDSWLDLAPDGGLTGARVRLVADSWCRSA